MKTVAQLVERLQALHLRTAETPLFNPLFQLSLDLSRDIESGDLSMDEVAGMVAELECTALKSRADRLRCLVEPADAEAALNVVLTGETKFEEFESRWSQPQLHAVFTAHPTFLLTSAQADAVARAASEPHDDVEAICAVPAERAPITLDYEHGQALAALARAQDARDVIVSRLLARASRQWPDRWREFAPVPFRFATWVGYDMDGRTDIKWHTSVSYRLDEKAGRLARYADSLGAIDAGHSLLGPLRRAAAYSAERAADFATDIGEPAAVSAAANRLTADHPDKLLSLQAMIAQLESEAADAECEQTVALRTLAAAMRADGLGMGWIHFRVNASQLHNAIRRRLPNDQDIDLGSRGAIVTLRAMLAEAQPLRANFAALAIESSTAIRQFLAMAQIVHHVDADAPIRMLIAECEQPATVLAALYFARLFGIDHLVDVSPLFETESALEHGGRLLDALLAEPAYREYARLRGRIAIQTGFSDAGRFVGQIPAGLAIERLQGRLAAAMAANGLTDVAALVFDTHGESMGRGAHPSSLADRLEWPLSPWARQKFARAGIRLEPEASFQGGDGYLLFATPELALATLTRIAALDPNHAAADAAPDPFYGQTDLSLDFYRAIKDHQHQHLESKTYARAITAFGLGMLVENREPEVTAAI